jgi:Spy/CpxP family protein refolding chaperone
MMSRHPLRVLAFTFLCAVAAAPAGADPVGAATPDCHERSGVAQADPQQPPARGEQKPGDKPQQGRWMWWRVPETKTELGITDQQATEIDQIFQAQVPALRAAKEELDKLDAEVAQVIKPATADVSVVNQLVGRAEQARAKLTTMRTVMFYRMHRVLSPDQRAKLNAMFERWDAQRRKNTDTRR